MKKLIFIYLFFFGISGFCQDLRFDIGIISGATSMQSDYGERGHFGSSYANIGVGGGIVYYISHDYFRKQWNDRFSFIKDHTRVRFEFSYMKTNLKHRGIYTTSNSPNIDKYNAMRGISTTLNYGLQFEYTMFNRSDERMINPYISLGFLGNYNTPKLNSTIGDIESNPTLIPLVYDNGISLKKHYSTAFTLGLGTRILPRRYDNNAVYNIDFRWQRFNSDTIDGLTPILNANKYNDWLLFFNIGYIYNLNF